MSVLIRGMEMPASCFACPFRDKVDPENIMCIVTREVFEETFAGTIQTRNRGNCPLISIPPHGDLIDRDALKAKQQEDADLFDNAYTLMEKSRRDEALNAVSNIINAPTVIPAEEAKR